MAFDILSAVAAVIAIGGFLWNGAGRGFGKVGVALGKLRRPVARSLSKGAPISVEWLQPKDIAQLSLPHRDNRSFALVVHTSLPVKSTDANLGNWSFVKGFYIWLGEDGHLNLHPVPDNRAEAKARYREQTQGKGIDGSGRTDCPS